MIKKTHEKGFTLLELMVVVAMITILAGLSIPNLNQWVQKQKLSKNARDILGVMQEAKAHAIEVGIPVVVGFSNGVGAAGTFTSFEDPNRNFIKDAKEKILCFGCVNKSVEITISSFETTSTDSTNTKKVSYTCFNGMGLAVGHSGEVRLKDIYNQTATLTLSNAGTIQITTGS